MNIVTAVTRALKADPLVVSLATGGIGKHAVPGDVEGTGKVKVAVLSMGSWFATQQTARFPRLRVIVAADQTRNSSLDKVAEDAHDRAMQCWSAIDAVLHRPTNETVVWGGASGVLVLGSRRATEASFVDRQDAESAWLVSSYHLKVVQ